MIQDDLGAPIVTLVGYEGYLFTATESCVVTTEPIAMVAPLTELTAFHIDCPNLTGSRLAEDGSFDTNTTVTISISGTVDVALVRGIP